MSGCWQEGDWRAYLDEELPAERMAWGREHLAQCAACARLHRELAERASRVSALMMDLEHVPALTPSAAPSRFAWRWGVAGLAAAAALAAAYVLAPKPAAPVRVPVAVEKPVALPPVSVPAAPVEVERASLGAPRQTRPSRRRPPRLQYYMALDEEPIDTGVVMRVSLASGVEADVIVDSEGRPRAIRAVR
ncbi:MAG TPA: zf-HC2 domain-containing protein [Candidatus Sulfopaludibacter sp.]|nr:zf-HC2 domain-containing protein [Candidatus Sulfopaludibacter sp.]